MIAGILRADIGHGCDMADFSTNRADGEWANGELLAASTRRHFFSDCRVGLGAMALASLAGRSAQAASVTQAAATPLAPKATHFPAKAKRVIFLFMAGGPSQLDLFDPKPKLVELSGQTIPESYVKGKRFAFIKADAKLLGSVRKFEQVGQSGAVIGETLPHLKTIADDICVLRAMKTDVFNHGPAKLFMNSGSPQFSGRPAMGSWLTYGIGSECDDLPGFVVLQSGPRGPRGGSALWSSGFLPTTYQGVPLRSGPEPILNLSSPKGFDGELRGEFTRAVNDLNRERLVATGDPEIATRIAAYEMAYRMQSSAPALMDLSGETKATLDAYGATPGKPSFANNCLLARRLVEKGVRFVQLYHTDWDHHGNPGTELGKSLDDRCKEVDQAAAALVKDLKARGLLDDTIVIWGGEFGRTPQGENREVAGRDHHVEAFTMWLAGGGVKPGVTIGQTDEIGYYGVEDRVHVHDLHATLLHLLGLDHLKLTYRVQGRDFRLTDVAGNVVGKMLA
jgi:hypothetical protein